MDWDRKIKLSMLASKQGERPFHEWAYGMQTCNALLRGRPYHFSEEALRETLENNMDVGLELRVRRLALATTLSLREWVETVKVEDEFVAGERKEAKEMAREIARRILTEQKTLRNVTNIASGSARPTGVGGPSNSTAQRPLPTTALPKLTPAERTILFDHQGCFKCRQLYVNHKGADCPNGFPAPSSYKTLTAAYAEAVRDSKNKPRPRVAAHVGQAETSVYEDAVEGSAVLGISDEISDDSDEYVRTNHTPPFSSGHLEWRCQIDGSSVSEPVVVTALIDNGSHSVLIDDGLVTKLGLRRRRLLSPQRARLAMGDEEVVFTEWVKLRTVSTDHQWTARVVRAIVAPNLAYSVILGGPWLQSNKIVIDHELGEVVAKEAQFQLLPDCPAVPAAIPEVAPTPRVLGRGDMQGDLLKELRERTKVRWTSIDK